jgi:hypothetical protein
MKFFNKDKKNGDSKSKDILKMVSEVKVDLEAYRKPREKPWREYEDAYHGKIWYNDDTYKPYENDLFSMIEGEVPILTDSIPSSSVRVDDPNKAEQGKVLNKSIEHVYKAQCFEMKYPMLVRASLISAPSYLHIYYDNNAKNGQGEIKHEILKWDQVYLDGKPQMIEECDKARLVLKRSKQWLKLNYQNFQKDIDAAKSKDFIGEGNVNSNDSETQDSGGDYSKRKRPQEYVDKDTLSLVKTFCISYDTEKIPEEETLEELQKEQASFSQGESPDISKWQDHKAHMQQHGQDIMAVFQKYGVPPEMGIEALEQTITVLAQESGDTSILDDIFQVKILMMHNESHGELLKENPKSERLKYLNGLRETHTLNDKIVLYDGSSIADHGQIPLAPFYCYRDGTIYGEGEIRNTIDSARLKAIIDYKEYKGLVRVANPNVFIDEETGLTEDDYSNEDGGVYVIPQGTSIRQADAGMVSPQLGQFSMDRKKAIHDISGINEVTQGKTPSPNAAAETVERTQNQAIGRIRLKDRQYQYYSIRRVAFLTSSEILQNWTEEKTIAVNNGAGQIDQYIFNPLDMQDLVYEVELESSSMAGIDKEAHTASLRQDVLNGFITYDQFLDLANIPRKEKIITARQETNEIQQQIQEKDAQIQEIAAQLESVQIENIRIKGEADIELLSNEEKQIFEQLKRDENIQAISGVISDQPEQGVI